MADDGALTRPHDWPMGLWWSYRDVNIGCNDKEAREVIKCIESRATDGSLSNLSFQPSTHQWNVIDEQVEMRRKHMSSR